MKANEFIHDAWRGDTLEALKAFIRLPSKSASFDEDWDRNGWLLKDVREAAAWGAGRFPSGTFEILNRPGITPALFIDLPATRGHSGRPVFFYGHFDKQPETEGWSAGLGPWSPVIRDGRLYGRGSSDDGYSFYAALTAVMALEHAGTPHPRIVGFFETDEESGSRDLGAYLSEIAPRCGNPCVLGILDLGICDHERIWLTRSLRGVVSFRLSVEVLERPVHSGIASGIVPSSFAIMRELLDRLEDPSVGRVKLPEFHTKLSSENAEAIRHCADILNDRVTDFPFAGNTRPRSLDPAEAIRLNAWEPSLSILGADGLPPTGAASALLRCGTTLTLSFRIPPHVDPDAALAAARRAVTEDVPSHARITISNAHAESGFEAPELAPWLEKAVRSASMKNFGNTFEYCFEGATIGTMKDFSRAFPNASFLNTGVLGAAENAHAPDESIHLEYVERLTCSLADIIAAVPPQEE